MIVWWLDLPVRSVLITTKLVNSNSVHGELYSIQYYVIKFGSDLRRSVVFTRYSTPVTSTNKTDNHDITEILLKLQNGAKHHKPTRNCKFQK